jgi:hypothetical protein
MEHPVVGSLFALAVVVTLGYVIWYFGFRKKPAAEVTEIRSRLEPLSWGDE